MARDHKNAPVEVSSKRPVSVLREVVSVVRKKAIDPRFDRAFGHFNKDLFGKTFDFLGDMQKSELGQLQASLKKEKNPIRRENIQKTLHRLISMQKTKEREERRQRLIREHRKSEAQLVEEGKTPYYLKRGDLKKLELVKEFEEHKQGRGNAADMERFIEKKRKRKASKQKKFMPE